MFKQVLMRVRPAGLTLACLLPALSATLSAAGAPATAQVESRQGSWHVELESRADSTDKGQVTYRVTAAQGLVQPDWKPVLTVSNETLTFASALGAGPKDHIIKYLSCDVLFREPDLTCDTVTIRLLPPSDAHGIAAKPALHFRRDFLAPGLALHLKIPHGFRYVAGSAHPTRVGGLLPTKPARTFVKPPQYIVLSDPATPHLLSLLLPAPQPRAVGTGLEDPYGVEFTLAPD